MAFLHARPIRTTKPTCVKMLMSISASNTAATEHSRHMGTTRVTASRSVLKASLIDSLMNGAVS